MHVYTQKVSLSGVRRQLYFFTKDANEIDQVIMSLQEEFELNTEEIVSSFLGIEFTEQEDGRIKAAQPYLIERILQATGLEQCNPCKTPAEIKPLGKCPESEERSENWNYASIIGMLTYLANSTRPDIQFAVHQCARFTHCPRRAHENAVKRICRYLKGTKTEGMLIRQMTELQLNCYADADFAGLWRVEHEQDPTCVKSRTGYIVTLGENPILWVSKLQSEVAVSTMEAEYIALSQSIRELLPLKRILKEVGKTFGKNKFRVITYSTIFEDNSGALTLAQCPKMTPRSKHIAVKYHFFRQFVTRGELEIRKVESSKQKADILTKGLTQQKFEQIRQLLLGW